MTDKPTSDDARKPPARERILDAASELFNTYGVNSVGIDAIIEHAGVAKMSLYKHFDSKDDLVAAFLEHTDDQWFAWLKGAVDRLAPTPKDRPLAIFDALHEWFESPGFRGCPFLNTQAELADGAHPAREACENHADRLRAFIEQTLRAAQVPSAHTLADDLLLLAEGAVTLAVVTGEPEPAKRAKRLARAVIARTT
jgi:AcrR family transcriptional regulator